MVTRAVRYLIDKERARMITAQEAKLKLFEFENRNIIIEYPEYNLLLNSISRSIEEQADNGLRELYLGYGFQDVMGIVPAHIVFRIVEYLEFHGYSCSNNYDPIISWG